MKKEATILFVLTLLYSLLAIAQEPYYYDNETQKEYAITKDLQQEMLDKYIEQNELKAIEYNPDNSSNYTFRVQLKNGDWLLYNSSNVEFVGDYSMRFPNPIFGYGAPITLTNHKKKTYFFSFLEERVLENLWFDQVEYYKIADTINVWNSEIQADEEEIYYKYLAAIKRKNKWALVYLDAYNYDGQVYQITPFSYKNKEDLPIEEARYFVHKLEHWRNIGFGNKFINLSDLLHDGEYSEIEFHPNYQEEGFELRLKNKKGNWHLFYGGAKPISLEGYSMQFPKYEQDRFTIAERKNKKYIYFLGEGGLQDHIWFDDYKTHYYERYDMFEERDENGYVKYDEDNNIIYRTDTNKIIDYIRLRRNDKWAMAFLYSQAQRLHQLTGFHFNTARSVPDSIFSNYYYNGEFGREYFNENMAENISKYLQENKAIDIATYFGEYSFSDNKSHSILKVRNAKTKHWSIQIVGGVRSETEFPVSASSIISHEYRGRESIVLESWCDNKVGYYYYNGEDIKKIKHCDYEDFKYIHLDYTYGCALKQNGFWELYNPESPQNLVDGKSKTIDGLIDLWLNR